VGLGKGKGGKRRRFYSLPGKGRRGGEEGDNLLFNSEISAKLEGGGKGGRLHTRFSTLNWFDGKRKGGDVCSKGPKTPMGRKGEKKGVMAVDRKKSFCSH